MNRISVLLLLTAALALGGCDSSDGAPSTGVETGPFKVLVYTRTASFRHNSIPTAIASIQSLGAGHGFAVDASEDPTVYTDANLAQYAVIAFVNTTGTIVDSAEQRGAIERFVARGGGFVGVHSAADTEYDWPFYAELIGAYFKNHPVLPVWAQGGPGVQPGDFHVEAPDHPAVAHLPQPWNVSDEFYAFRSNPRGRVRVLMTIDENSYNQNPNTSNLPTSPSFPLGETGTMGDHPMSWCHDKLGGRAWYTALGHSEHIYANPVYLEHLRNGILTAARRLDADCAAD
ncbi:MAG TPA: ThuA domain-containing protein [Solimonas sp.]